MIPNKETEYVIPNYQFFQSSDELFEFLNQENTAKLNQLSKKIAFEEILSNKTTFVLGEPGFGKSRLLKTLFEKSKNKAPFFIDLKSIKEDIESHFRKVLNNDLNNVEAIFLDALDEVHIDLISKRLIEIKNISSRFPNIKLIISCRTHHIKRHLQSLYDFKFSTVVLKHFQYHQIEEFLKKNCKNIQEEGLKSLLKMIHGSYNFSYTEPRRTLYTPRYLNILSQLINKNGAKAILNLERSELFDKFINDRLTLESAKKADLQKGYKQKIPYIKQYLERLALIMEIQRVNKISKEDFVTFELDTQMNINNQLLLEVFFDGTILKDRDDYLEFDNTEFQEYLAAKAIIRLGNTEQIIFDLAIDQNLNAIYPTWYNVLSFIVELKAELILPLILFGIRAKEPLFFELINFAPKKYLAKKEDSKSEIFNLIFDYYCKNNMLFTLGFEKVLATFFEKDKSYEKIKQCPEGIKTISQYFEACNAISILKGLVTESWFTNEHGNFWKKKLISFVKIDFEFGDYLHRISLETLVTISSIEELFTLKTDTSIKKRAIQKLPSYLRKKAPNHNFTIQLVCDDFFNSRNLFVLSPLQDITTSEGFKNLFTYLLSSIKGHSTPYQFREKLNEELSNPNSPFFSKLIKNWNNEVKISVVQTIIEFSFGHPYREHSFYDNLLAVLVKKEENIHLDILEELNSKEINDKNDWGIGGLIGYLMDLDNYKTIIKKLKSDFAETDLLKNALRQNNIPEISQLFSEYYPEMEEKWKQNREQLAISSKKRKEKTEKRNLLHIEKFKNCLRKGHSHVVTEYNNHSAFYQSALNKNDKLELKNIILGILDSYVPSKATVKITSHENESSKTIYTTNVVRFYRAAVELAEEFKIDLTPYRKKILTLIPFLFHETKWVFEIVKDPSKEEIQFFVNWFINRNEDSLQQHGFSHFLDVCEKFELKETIGFLETFLKNKELEYYERIRIYELVFQWNVKPIDFFIEEFKTYKDAEAWSDDYKVALKINEYLLQKQNESAFEWRIEQTLKHKYLQKKLHTSGFRLRGVQSPEGMGVAFKYLTEERFKKKFLVLLEESFKVLNEDPDYETFVSNEIWNVVIGYFKFLKTNKIEQKRNLDLLRNLFEEYSSNFEVKNFEYRMNQVRAEYISYLGEPEPFFNCVKKFNEIKAKKYLEIAYSQDLFNIVCEVINDDLRKWVEQGGYGIIKNMPKIKGKKREREKVIQKTIVTQLENYLLKKGLRNSDIKLNFYREVEKLNNDKVDLIITYGSIGAIMIELKLAYNLGKNQEYKATKFMPYMEETECDFGIFLIFKIDESTKNFSSKLQKLEVVYTESNIEVIGIDCVK